MAVEAKNRAWSALEGQKGNTAGEIHDFADALRQTARRLHEERHNTVAQYAERVADGLDSLSRSLREKNLETLIRDTEDFARRQPALFIGGAAAIGFVAARFLKASGEQPMGRSGRRMSESSGDTAGEWTAPSYYGTGSPAAAASGGTVGSETRRSDNIAGGGI